MSIAYSDLDFITEWQITSKVNLKTGIYILHSQADVIDIKIQISQIKLFYKTEKYSLFVDTFHILALKSPISKNMWLSRGAYATKIHNICQNGI